MAVKFSILFCASKVSVFRLVRFEYVDLIVVSFIELGKVLKLTKHK